MFKNKQTGFFCFSPPVMLATFIIEIILMVLVVVKRKLNTTAKLVAAALFFLAFFQLCEYFVCGGLGVNALMWSRLGFIAITTLPPLGLHIIHEVSGRRLQYPVIAAYGLMATFIVFFGFSESAFTNHQCVSNYVIFHLHAGAGYLYSAYYYGLLLLGIYFAMQYATRVKKPAQKQALYGMVAGYLVFLVPTAVANTINPQTMAGIPSIMCGFAVLFAILLYNYVLPRTSQKKH